MNVRAPSAQSRFRKFQLEISPEMNVLSLLEKLGEELFRACTIIGCIIKYNAIQTQRKSLFSAHPRHF